MLLRTASPERFAVPRRQMIRFIGDSVLSVGVQASVGVERGESEGKWAQARQLTRDTTHHTQSTATGELEAGGCRGNQVSSSGA